MSHSESAAAAGREGSSRRCDGGRREEPPLGRQAAEPAGREQEGELFISDKSRTVWLPTRTNCVEWTGSTQLPSHQGNTSALYQILLPLHFTVLFSALRTPLFPRIYFALDNLFQGTYFLCSSFRLCKLIPESPQHIYRGRQI